MASQRCRRAKGLTRVGRRNRPVLEARTPPRLTQKLGWGPTRAWESPASQEYRARPGLFSQLLKGCSSAFFSNGLSRSISEELSNEDMLSDDVTEEAAKNTILNTRLTSIDHDGLSSPSLQSKEETVDKEED